MARLAALALAVLLSTGCALLTRSRPAQIRYFSPEALSQPAAARAAAMASNAPMSGTALELRLGRVNAAAYLRERIAFRGASAEIGYYSAYRWADPPEAYLRRALARAFFEEHQLHEIVSGSGPALEVDLDAFEELRAPRRAARISVTWRLRGDRTILLQRTLTIERPITAPAAAGPDDIGPAIVAALAEAMAAAVDSIVADVVSELSRPDTHSRAPSAVTESATAPR